MWHTEDDIHAGAMNLLAHQQAQPQHPPIIRQEQVADVHTQERPYCLDKVCPCMPDRAAIEAFFLSCTPDPSQHRVSAVYRLSGLSEPAWQLFAWVFSAACRQEIEVAYILTVRCGRLIMCGSQEMK